MGQIQKIIRTGEGRYCGPATQLKGQRARIREFPSYLQCRFYDPQYDEDWVVFLKSEFVWDSIDGSGFRK